MAKLSGPLSAVQVFRISHPYTNKRDRDAVLRNEEKTLGQARSMTETYATRYLNDHPLGKVLAAQSEAEWQAAQ